MEQLWQQYQNNKDEKLRNQLVEKYLPLVRIIVARMGIKPVGSLDEQDLISAGLFGLLQAVENYDAARGVKFETYASNRIRGAVLDELRKNQWLPRSVTDKLRRLQREEQLLQQRLGREVTEVELAEALGMPLGELQQLWWYAASQAALSLDEFLFGEDGQEINFSQILEDRKSTDPQAELEAREYREFLIIAINTLKEKEKLVLNLYYADGLTMKEIGRLLEISESRVCQLHGRALVKLRSRLKQLLSG